MINPDNPTGAVYPERILTEIISICKEFDLFPDLRRDLSQPSATTALPPSRSPI